MDYNQLLLEDDLEQRLAALRDDVFIPTNNRFQPTPETYQHTKLTCPRFHVLLTLTNALSL